eukprot:TRINITY_DN19843_c0_g1_i1.p1 TRINITY_DN19843_c0_g1~~TRINITY_DN19843_c0_g1_i1.p1  ORF type:complete len:1434 (-),score=390.27 TRINITY_DN19843_c0_g1_i1:267-4568(-)
MGKLGMPSKRAGSPPQVKFNVPAKAAEKEGRQSPNSYLQPVVRTSSAPIKELHSKLRAKRNRPGRKSVWDASSSSLAFQLGEAPTGPVGDFLVQAIGDPLRRHKCMVTEAVHTIGYGRLKEEVHLGILMSDINHVVTEYWRKQRRGEGQGGGSSFPKGGAGGAKLRQRAWDIIQLLRRNAVLTREVQHFLLLEKLLAAPVEALGGEELAHDRMDRQQEFWGQYHECARGQLASRERSSEAWRGSASRAARLARQLASQQGSLSSRESSRLSAQQRPSRGEHRPHAASVTPTPRRLRRKPFTDELEDEEEDRQPEVRRKFGSCQRLSDVTGSGTLDHDGFLPQLSPSTAKTPNTPSYHPAAGASLSSLSYWPTLCTDTWATDSLCLPLTPSRELPPLAWSPPEGGAVEATADTHCAEYIKTCITTGIRPMPIPFVTGHSSKFSVTGSTLVDRSLTAMIPVAKQARNVEEIDLTGNVALTDKAIGPFLKSFVEKTSAKFLRRISLSRCQHAGHGTLNAVIEMLSEAGVRTPRLKVLNLSGVPISMKEFVPLASQIRSHPMLQELHMADAGLGCGRGGQTSKVLTDLLACKTLEVLDIGWSVLGAEHLAHLGLQISKSATLKSLHIPSCSSTSPTGRDVPIEFFLEYLSQNKSLTELDVSLNHIDYRGSLIIEDALERHQTLKNLILCDNQLGTAGLRSVLRLLAQVHSALTHLRCEGCSSGALLAQAADQDSQQIFSLTNPGGRYQLDLSRPYHRSFLRMLYKVCERFGQAPPSAIGVVSTSPGFPSGFPAPSKNNLGIWQVPTQGKIVMTFHISWEQVTKDMDPWDFADFLKRHYETARIHPPFSKIVPVFGHWHKCADYEKEPMLNALARDFMVTFPQVAELSSVQGQQVDVLSSLMHCLVGGETARYMSFRLVKSFSNLVKVMAELKTFDNFKANNPTGHYVLDLGKAADMSVAENLLLLDRWEAELEASLGRADISHKGNRSHIRNARYQGRSLVVRHSSSEWNLLPDSDVFEFDYVSGKRPPANCQAIEQKTFVKMLQAFQKLPVLPIKQFEALAGVAPYIFVSALQLRELFGLFSSDALRADTLVLFYFRVADIHNEKVFRVRFANCPEELQRLRSRLGALVFFPFIQPERSSFRFDFAQHDQRVAAHCLLTFCTKEKVTNFSNVSYVDSRGQPEPLTQGIPRTWLMGVEKMPTAGVLAGDYNASPDERHLPTRRQCLEKFGLWKLPNISDRDVMWWSAVNEAPYDVMLFMEWLVSRFPDVHAPFWKIDGMYGGGGQFSLVQFMEGFEMMKCRVFKGADEADRIRGVFRYLDPSGEGLVSKGEWDVLDQLWKEMSLCLVEFVSYLQRLFDFREDFLEEAWIEMDENDTGEISEIEWQNVVIQKLHYFGPSRTIFKFLDADGEGSVSYNEFILLERFRGSEEPGLPGRLR